MIGNRLSSLTVVWQKREYRACLLIMILSSLGVSSSAPLISLYLVNQLHLGLPIVGLFFAGQALPGFVIALLVGRWSDRWRSRLPSIRLAALWVGLGWLVFAFSPYPWLNLAVGPVFLSAGGVIMGQTFATLHDVMVRDGEPHPGLVNTTVRTGFSFGYVFGPLLGSELAAQISFRAAFVATACVFLLCLAPLWRQEISVVSSARRGETADAELRANRPLFLFATLAALVMCGTAIKNTYLPIDVTTQLHGTIGVYGTIVAVSPVVELVVMPLSGVLALRFPIGRLIALGLGVATLEYFLLSSSTALWQLYATQAMDAWVVAVVMGLGVTYAQQLSPERPGLASGTFGSSFGVALVVGNLIGSVTVPLLGVPHVFLIPTLLCAASLVTFLITDSTLRSRAQREIARPVPGASE